MNDWAAIRWQTISISTAQSSPSAPKSLDDFPADVLAQVLQHVDQAHRLGVCALLSSRCRSAANAATTAIKLHCDASSNSTAANSSSTSKFNNLFDWLKLHGGDTLSLALKPAVGVRLAPALPAANNSVRLLHSLKQLPPCPRLSSLALTECEVQLTRVPLPAAAVVDPVLPVPEAAVVLGAQPVAPAAAAVVMPALAPAEAPAVVLPAQPAAAAAVQAAVVLGQPAADGAPAAMLPVAAGQQAAGGVLAPAAAQAAENAAAAGEQADDQAAAEWAAAFDAADDDEESEEEGDEGEGEGPAPAAAQQQPPAAAAAAAAAQGVQVGNGAAIAAAAPQPQPPAAAAAVAPQLGVLHGCIGLTSLSLHDCIITDTPEQLSGLSVLSALQQLSITWGPAPPLATPRQRRAAKPRPARPLVLPGSLLSHLVQLTSLTLSTECDRTYRAARRLELAMFDTLQHVSCLTALHNLCLPLPATTQSEEFSGIGALQQLTYLELHCRLATELVISLSDTPGFAQLTALQRLQLSGVACFDPNVLRDMTKMWDLVMYHVQLADGAAGTTALLSAVQRMRLTGLKLVGSLQHCAAPSAYCAALAAPTDLVILRLANCKLPAGLWQSLHASGVRLPHVWLLNIDDISGDGGLLSAADLSGLVGVCPAITTLSCNAALSDTADFSALAQAARLTQLVTDRVRDVDAPALAALVGLRDLIVNPASSTLSDTSLLRLTALTRLTRLWVCCNTLSRDVALDLDINNRQCVYLCDNTLPPVISHAVPEVPVFGVAGLLYKRCMRNSLCQPIMCQTLRSQFTAWQRALSASQEQTQLVQQQRDWAYNESAQSQASLTECRNELSYYTSMPSMPQLTYMTQQLAVREAQVTAAGCAMGAREAAVAQREARVTEREAAVLQREAAAAGNEARAATVDSALDARAAAVAQMQLAAAGHQAALAAAQQGFEQRTAAVCVREHQMSAAAAQLAGREQSVRQAAAALQAALQSGGMVTQAQMQALFGLLQHASGAG